MTHNGRTPWTHRGSSWDNYEPPNTNDGFHKGDRVNRPLNRDDYEPGTYLDESKYGLGTVTNEPRNAKDALVVKFDSGKTLSVGRDSVERA